MRKRTRALLVVLTAVLAVIILTLVLGYGLNRFIVDLWWFRSLDYEPYFWYRLLYRYVVLFLATLLFFLIFFLNFWIGAKYLGAQRASPAEGRGALRAQRLYDTFQRRSLIVYLPLSLALAVVVALPLFAHWEEALLYLAAPSAGLSDPVFGKDISYYLFSLPIYLLLFGELLISFVIVFLGLATLYWLEARSMPQPDRRLRRGARTHLSVVIFIAFLIGAWYFVLQADLLLYTDDHLPLFFGPGFLQMHVILPLIWTAMGLMLVMALAFVYFINTGKGKKTLIGAAVLFLAVLGVRYLPATTSTLQRFVVVPNEMALQTPYIANNIQATLDAYQLQDVEMREYPIRAGGWDLTTRDVRRGLQNSPIWDEHKLQKVYEQLQEIRSYYTFAGVDVGRYTIDGDYRQVFLAPREIDLSKLPESAGTWVNRWLKYTHGYGIAMVSAAQHEAGPIEWIIQGIPPQSEDGMYTEQPAIYYGDAQEAPVIAPNDSREIDYISDGDVTLNDYQGTGGVSVFSLFSKLVLSLYFHEENILYTTRTNANSRVLFRRNVIDRVTELTPFLLLEESPYPVMTREGIYWMLDAFTASSRYPYAMPHRLEGKHASRYLSYIRNSVKILVDAYNGTVDYYIADPEDPIIRAYDAIYPGLFKPLDQMPTEIRRHVRYPKTLFDIQTSIYATYHQTSPDIFYKQEDVWVLPKVRWNEEMHTIDSYYITLNLVDPNEHELSLFVPLNPKERDNMRALMVAGCDGDSYGKLVAYGFPKGKSVFGPAQFDAVVKQDPDITQEFTLWNQQGSRATRGRMVILPIDGVVTYIQGVFLEATTQASIPELARLIVSQGELVVMRPSLMEALSELNDRIEEIRMRSAPGEGVPPPAEVPAVTPEGPGE